MGKDLFHQLDKEHDLLDRDFRLFAEECDQMQGVQIIMSSDDAWGGFGSEYVAALRDEYSKIAIVTWGLESGDKVPRVSLLNYSLFFFWKSYSTCRNETKYCAGYIGTRYQANS